jgi:two-component system chemotaxis sensor kinase CheA
MRVPVERVDHLLNLVGELGTINEQGLSLVADQRALEMQIREWCRQATDAGWPPSRTAWEQMLGSLRARVAALHRSSRRVLTAHGFLVREVREASMHLRLLPASDLFERFPRPVRDLARAAGKEVRLVVEGEETRLDKKILDELYDPVLHLLRNAVGHGIEPPAAREAAGKPREGTVTLRALPRGRESPQYRAVF